MKKEKLVLVESTPAKVLAPPRKITPPPFLSGHVRNLVEAAYRCGWADRAQIEKDLRDGLLESAPEEAKIEESEFVRVLVSAARS